MIAKLKILYIFNFMFLPDYTINKNLLKNFLIKNKKDILKNLPKVTEN
jgi:hypothetical protein